MPVQRSNRPSPRPPSAAPKLQAVPALDDSTEGQAPRRRGRPPRLSRAAIFRAALDLIDAEGAAALTMRRLGAEMGVEAMSLYRHVASKDALLDGVAEQLMAEHEVGVEDHDWAVSAQRFTQQIHTIARAHPAAFDLVGLRALNTVDAMRPVEALLAALREGGFTPDRAVAAFRLLSGYSRGFALSEIAGFTLASATDGNPRLTGDKLPAEGFPAIHELTGELARESTEDDFRAGVETIIAGLREDLASTPRIA
jgi:AcrR family transcriptional regulator